MFDFNSDKIEEHFAQYAVFQMEFTEIKLKFNVQALFDAHFHFNWSVCIWLSADICNDKFFLFRYPIIVSVDDHVDVVPQSYHYSIIAFELLFHSIELKVVLHIVSEGTRRFQITNNLQESRILVFVIKVFNDSYKFNSYAEVVNTLVLIESNGNLALDIFSILKKYDDDKSK